MTHTVRALRGAAGLALALLGTVPLYRLLEGWGEVGHAGRMTAETVEIQASVLWSGTLVVVLVALLGGLFFRPGFWDAAGKRIALLLRPSVGGFAAALAVAAFAVTASFTILALAGQPNLVDTAAQLFHARYMAAGRLAAPVPDEPAFWYIPNTVLSGGGWASQYPPTHPALLSLGLRVGLVTVLPGALMAVTAAFSYLSLRRLLPGRELLARVAAIGVAISPFLVAQTGSYMNHGSAAALSVLAVYFALRARDDGPLWAAPLGMALALQLANRPLVALVVAFGVVTPLALAAVRRQELTWGGLGARAGVAVVGGLPFVAALLAYNASLFGGPFDTGYVLAWGEGVGLGFHQDPWGNVYSPQAAVAYTSADLTALSLALLETPFPVVAMVGLWWATARGFREGEGILLAWALVPVAANFLYWHHGHFMGSRMLTEAAPPWIALTVLAAARIYGRLPEELPGGAVRLSPRQAFATGMAAAVLAAAYLGPVRLANLGGDYLRSMRPEVPAFEEPSLVFVHDGWNGRVIGRLASAGLPPHEIERVVVGYDLCRLQQVVDAADSRDDVWGRLPDGPDRGLVDYTAYPGQNVYLSRNRFRGGELHLPPECAMELAADRHGVASLVPFLWRGGLPGLDERTVYVRDLGPELNASMVARYPDRPRHYMVRDEHQGEPSLLRYEEGSRLLWGQGP